MLLFIINFYRDFTGGSIRATHAQNKMFMELDFGHFLSIFSSFMELPKDDGDKLKYMDEDGDWVTIQNSEDLQFALTVPTF